MLKHTQDAPWHGAKKQIASRTRELTALWFLGAEKRDALLVREPPITRWDHPDLCTEVAGIRGEVDCRVMAEVIGYLREHH